MHLGSIWYDLLYAFTCNENAIKTNHYPQKILKFFLYLLCYFSTCISVTFLIWTWKEVICLILFLSMIIVLAVLQVVALVLVNHCIYALLSCVLFVQHHSSVCFLLICSYDACVSTVLQFIVKTSSISISGMHNNTGPYLGPTKYFPVSFVFFVINYNTTDVLLWNC